MMDLERDKKFEKFVIDDEKNNRGRLVNACEELSFLLDNPYYNRIVAKRNLNDILTYATSFSKFYKPFTKFTCLTDFPIMTKQDLKDNWDDILVKEMASLPDSRTKYTSGSTGTPFKMVLDRYKHCRWIAGNKIFRAKVGIPSHTKTVFINDNVEDKNIPMERQERDNVYYISCRYMDKNSIVALIQYLIDNKVRTMTAMASFWDRVASLIVDGNLPKWGGGISLRHSLFLKL